MRGVAVKGQPPQLSEFLTGTQENYSMHSMQTLASVPEEGSPIGSSMTGNQRIRVLVRFYKSAA